MIQFKCNRFEYFLNAVHYCMWRNEVKFGRFNEKIADHILSPVINLCFSEKYKKRYEQSLTDHKENDMIFYDKKSGMHIGWANHWFGYLYSCYPCCISFIMFALILRWNGYIGPVAMLLTLAVPIGLGYILAYKAVFSKDRYLKYFKEFEKKDAAWHSKWSRVTMGFCVGAVLMSIFSIFGACMILLA